MNGIGVRGRTGGNASQVAVMGDASVGLGEGYGVKGLTQNGIGVYASATGGYALQVAGLAVFSRSGKVTFAQGQRSRTISRTILSTSLVLATIQDYAAGVWVAGVTLNAPADTFTIRLNKGAPTALKVGWFIVN